MRLITLATLFLIPLIGFASFPIQTTTTSDTIIESKKETMEEYKIRIQKQLYKPTEKKYKNSIKEIKKPIKMSTEGILFSTAIILILTAAIVGVHFIEKTNGLKDNGVHQVTCLAEVMYSLMNTLKNMSMFKE